MGGAVKYVYRDGQRLTEWMLYVIILLNTELSQAFPGIFVKISSAIRTREEQKRIFLARYVTADRVNGRRVYDTRWWNGRLWYRISSAGTVAAPGTSNHEIQGTKAAVDIRDTGRDAGITSRNSARGKWIRAWCKRTGLMIASGDGFGEGWHFDIPGIFRTPPGKPAGGGKTTTKEVKVKHYFNDDKRALAKGGKSVAPSGGFWLHTDAKAPDGNASNIVGAPGEYSFVTHVYLEGTPGDTVDVVLAWDNVKTTGAHSMHFVERVEIGADGFARRNIPFHREVASGYAVYARVAAAKGNKATVRVTRLATDALQFTPA